MASLFPFTVRSKILLRQLELQCCLFRRQLVSLRQVSSHAAKKQPIAAPLKASFPPQIQPQALRDENDHDPKPLNRALGLQRPPVAGENSGIDLRDWRTRRDDFFNYDKHLERRKALTRQVSRSYFKDWSNMRFQKGKVFIAPRQLLRADKALYFPNLRGITLADPKDEQDTTPILSKRLSLVVVFTGTWAQNQTETFLKNNERLDRILEAGKGFIQRIDINIEENSLRAGLVRWFMGGLRRNKLPELYSRYFLVRRGITDEIREGLGMFNRQVGYIYLVDGAFRVRWACSAEAIAEEKESMIKGLVRLSREFKLLAEEEEKANKWEYVDVLGQTLTMETLGAKVNSITKNIEL